MKSNSLNLVERVKAPTPKWFKIIRTIGITLTAVGGAILTAPIALPATIVTVGGYLILGGTVATAISQTAMQTDNDNEAEQKENSKQP
ncbi:MULTISPECIES: hypothetical protein [Chryseobacterium group]|uniref:hypothetical protein n=1 Tax=Candidatus Kaistella beijingensis TaxID=2820270 RepID=UPI00096276BD|nr:hypothetical protein [Candidatus Kaistella beijingensis]MBN9292391.1 hypothetical protein [Flavobacteriia bacterium]OJX36298.1 MAG: hypothetical protein BGO87_07540 [Flavobacteriia bacterium 40-80]RQP10545.1 MAG: hypothetical protein EAS48_07225 [Chryseobacterium sp.]UBB89968.1 hypothetical protein J4771_01040 [Candidatus Kaistella beijingensis]